MILNTEIRQRQTQRIYNKKFTTEATEVTENKILKLKNNMIMLFFNFFIVFSLTSVASVVNHLFSLRFPLPYLRGNKCS